MMFHYFLLLLHTAASTSLPTCDDVMEENQRMKEEIKWLNDVIANNITELAAMVAANSLDISSNTDSISTNNLEIQDNSNKIGIVSGRTTTNEAHIATTNLRLDEIIFNLDALEAEGEICLIDSGSFVQLVRW